MDKRWILILIIMIIAILCGYYITQSSPNVGNAVANINKSSVTLPYGFSVKHSDAGSIELINKNTLESIYLEDLGKNDNAKSLLDNQLKKISKTDNYKVMDHISNTTSNGVTVYIVHYIDLNNTNFKNQSISYFYTWGHTFYAKLSCFDSADSITEKTLFIAETIQPDYKKPQDDNKQPEQSEDGVKLNRTIKAQD